MKGYKKRSDIGGFIRQMRKLKGLTQMDLGEALGVTYQQVQKYENGTTQLTITRLEQLADALDVTISSFINTGPAAADSGGPLSDKELALLRLFRKLRKENQKDSFIAMLNAIVDKKDK
jgi:transcriptional regulator with XRE-family HTH domain